MRLYERTNKPSENMYVCVYIYMYVHLCVHIYIYVYICGRMI